MQATYQDRADASVVESLDRALSEVGGGLAPVDPYLQWSLSKREAFVSQTDAEVVREYPAGLYILRMQDAFYIARRFMKTNGWFWSCVPVRNAQPDNKMLHSMMDGAA